MKIAFFGDSVTEGIFELLLSRDGKSYDLVRDGAHVYPTVLGDLIRAKHPEMPLEIMNFGISGNNSGHGVSRVGDVIGAAPDACVVCFGLNDLSMRDPDTYGQNMEEICRALTGAGIRTYLLTPNRVCSYVLPGMPHLFRTVAEKLAECQNDGTFDRYLHRACETAQRYGIPVADAYAEWTKLENYGIDTTALLANGLNHPTRAMHRLFADLLLDVMEKDGLFA